MDNNNQNKFNTTSKSKSFFPIKQHRFDSAKHPIIQSTQKCAARMTTMLSAQEDQMLEGLISSLQCNQREAIRIALHEASRSGFKALQNTSRRGGKERQQQARAIQGALGFSQSVFLKQKSIRQSA